MDASSGVGADPLRRALQFSVADRRSSKRSAVTAVEQRAKALRTASWDRRRESLWALAKVRRRVDYAALPPELARKASARTAAVGGPIIYGRMDPTRRMAPWLFGTLAGLTLLAPLLIGIVVLAGGAPALGIWLVPLPWVVVAAVWAADRRWKVQGPLTISRAEAALVRQHTSIVKFDLLLTEVWEDHHAIAATAAVIIGEIETSPAWQSPHCDLDRIQLDLAEETFQIAQSCEHLGRLRAMVVDATPSVGPESDIRTALHGKVAEYNALYREARRAVISRVAALYTYRQRLTEIERLLVDLAKMSDLAARSDDFTEAFAAITRDTMAAQRTEALAEDLTILKSRLEAELAFITGAVIADPDLATPLSVWPPAYSNSAVPVVNRGDQA